MYMSIKTLNYVIFSHQANLSKTTKHWDGFVSHCITICWSSRLQSIVTLLTTEAEYVTGVAAGKEICWLQNLLGELGYTAPAPSKLFIDNQSALSVAKNPEHHG